MALRWFRFGQKQEEQDTRAGEALPTEPEAPPEAEPVAAADAVESGAPRKKRRRGSRGGRGRKKKTATTAGEVAAPGEAVEEPKAARSPATKSARGSDGKLLQ